MIFVLSERNSNTTSLMSSSTYETCLQGIMVSVLIILDCRYFVLMNKSTMIPCRCISQKELAIVKTTEYLGIQSVVVILKFLMFVLLSSLAFNPLLKNRSWNSALLCFYLYLICAAVYHRHFLVHLKIDVAKMQSWKGGKWSQKLTLKCVHSKTELLFI